MTVSMQKFNDTILNSLEWTGRLAHVIISLALIMATMMLTVYFFHELYDAVMVHSLIKGFLHALGVLLLLWTMVELITTEIRFLQGKGLDAAVFVEVALIVVVREVIMLPVEDAHPAKGDMLMWVGATALLGLTYLFLHAGRRLSRRDAPES